MQFRIEDCVESERDGVRVISHPASGVEVEYEPASRDVALIGLRRLVERVDEQAADR